MKGKTLQAIEDAANLVAALDAAGWGLVVLRADKEADIRRVIERYPHKSPETDLPTKDIHNYPCNMLESIGGDIIKNFYGSLQYSLNDDVCGAEFSLMQWLLMGISETDASAYLHRLLYISNINELLGPSDVDAAGFQPRTQEQTKYIHLIRALCEAKKQGRTHHLIVAGSQTGILCKELSEYAYIVDIGCPTEEEIIDIIKDTCQKCGGRHNGLEAEKANELAAISRGLRQDDIRSVINLAFALYERPASGNAEELFRAALEAKKQRIAGVRGLTWINNNAASKIGGLKKAQEWLELRSATFNYVFAARKFEVATPKGVLLAGLPGCGKTLFAKFASHLLSNGKSNHFPVLQMDLSTMLGKYVGESEINFANALRSIEDIAPCIVIVDEIEKFFGGVSDNANEASKHIFSAFLGWMQEEHGKPILVIATANKVDKLPPELKRKGRFDETFFVGIPTCDDCKEILRLHLENKKEIFEPNFNYGDVINSFVKNAAKFQRFFNGADIESIVNAAFCALFSGLLNHPNTKSKIDELQREGKLATENVIRYKTEQVKKALLAELERTRSYFDNNMDESAEYWVLMRRLNFRNASDSDLFENISFDEETGKFEFPGISEEDSKYLKEVKKKLETASSAESYDEAFRYKLALSIFKYVKYARENLRRN